MSVIIKCVVCIKTRRKRGWKTFPFQSLGLFLILFCESSGQQLKIELCLSITLILWSLFLAWGLFFVPQLILSEIMWHMEDLISVKADLANLVFQSNLQIWFKYLVVWDYCTSLCSLERADLSIPKSMISNAAIGWWQESIIMTSYKYKITLCVCVCVYSIYK